MRSLRKKHVLWSLGLSEEQCETVRTLAGPDFELYSWPAGTMPNFTAACENGMPCLICFSMDACAHFTAMPVAHVGHLDLVPKMLLLAEEADLATMEKALDFGVTDIIRPPLTRERFAGCLRRASEAASLHRDVQNMAREIFTERELLERKNEALSFLVDFLTTTSEPFDEAGILRSAYTSLQKLFPVTTMHAVLFGRNDLGDVSASLYMAVPKSHPAHDEWRSLLMETSEAIFEGSRIIPTTMCLPLQGCDISASPSEGHLMTLPLRVSDDAMFFLMLLTPMARNLSRDQTLALDSALRHLALSLKNARNYQQMCHFAECDSLTGMFNRRNGEDTLRREVSRHRRYGQDLSLIILDLDHFKKINDTWGHLVGDEVLRGTAEAMKGILRSTDSCCRFGGEEFVIILPHTSLANAEWLAERLRHNICQLRFEAKGKEFSVTASMGVACIAEGKDMEMRDLLDNADKALYQAKNTGRNRVVCADVERPKIAAI